MTYEEYKKLWSKKTTKQIEKELNSWRKYVDKHSSAYAWHGASMTPPNSLSDGDKISALKEILSERNKPPADAD